MVLWKPRKKVSRGWGVSSQQGSVPEGTSKLRPESANVVENSRWWVIVLLLNQRD